MESGLIDLVVDIIDRVGFPIFVTLWFMLRTEKVIQRNTEAFQEIIKYLAREEEGDE